MSTLDSRRGWILGSVLALLAIIAITALLAFSARDARAQTSRTQSTKMFYFGPFEVENGDVVRLHRVLYPPEPGVSPGPIGPDDPTHGARGTTPDDGMPVLVRFFGPGGEVIANELTVLGPGEVDTMELSGREILDALGGGLSAPIWVEVRPVPARSEGAADVVVIPHLKVFKAAGGSQIENPLVLVGFNPQPEPPALLPH